MSATPTGARNCKGCGKPLLFVKNQDGKVVPLDLTAPVYSVQPDLMGVEIANRAERMYVSHFSTCPKANDFSKGRKP